MRNRAPRPCGGAGGDNVRAMTVTTTRNLVVVLGDQLDARSAAFDGFDAARDVVLMMEVRQEAAYVPQHRKRLVFFFAAMRHFRDALCARGWRVDYVALTDAGNGGDFGAVLRAAVARWLPEGVRGLAPGDFRVREALLAAVPGMRFVPDRHFFCDTEEFGRFMAAHRKPILENFYRAMRRRHDVLMDGAAPVGGAWNFDHDNREALGRDAPPMPETRRFSPDAVTREVMAMVRREFPDAPGTLEDFDLPVTAADAAALLRDFVTRLLPHFGRYQDAMKRGQAFLFHSRLSGPLNLHLLDPREVLTAVLANPGGAPLNAVEGYVRQILGWREFVRGIYWHLMPEYATRNTLAAGGDMPRFYWTGATDMACLREAIGHTLDHAYAHHIERLMVLGLYAQLLGVRPYAVHEWHMSMFWDAIDWVSLPNTLGMSQHGDGGVMGTKPYVASGKYISRMGDYCRGCRYDPAVAVGERACPFTTLFWEFLARHQGQLSRNARMANMYANLRRKDPGELAAIRRAAETLRGA